MVTILIYLIESDGYDERKCGQSVDSVDSSSRRNSSRHPLRLDCDDAPTRIKKVIDAV